MQRLSGQRPHRVQLTFVALGPAVALYAATQGLTTSGVEQAFSMQDKLLTHRGSSDISLELDDPPSGY